VKVTRDVLEFVDLLVFAYNRDRIAEETLEVYEKVRTE